MADGVVGLSFEDYEPLAGFDQGIGDTRLCSFNEAKHGIELAEYMIVQWGEYLQSCRMQQSDTQKASSDE